MGAGDGTRGDESGSVAVFQAVTAVSTGGDDLRLDREEGKQRGVVSAPPVSFQESLTRRALAPVAALITLLHTSIRPLPMATCGSAFRSLSSHFS